MKNHMLKNVIYILAVLLLPLCSNTKGQNTNIVINSSAELKQRWLARIAARDDDIKDRSINRVFFLKDLITKTSRDVRASEFNRICHTNLVDKSDQDDDPHASYDCVMLEALVSLSIDKKNVANFVQLVTNNCPDSLGRSSLEYSLAKDWRDHFELLFDCYRKAKTQHVRQKIAFCLGQAFPSLHDSVSGEANFVKEAEKWYKEHKPQLEVNFGCQASGRPASSSFINPELFILKKTGPATNQSPAHNK